MSELSIIIITGLSGSGKSTALAAFEDAGFYCVDNLPVDLLPKFLELPMQSTPGIEGLAFVMDLREKGFVDKYPTAFKSLRKKGYNCRVLFLESDEEKLIQRYSQTRRYHPLALEKGLLEGIRAEKEQLKDLRVAADDIINTSDYTVHQLKSLVFEIARRNRDRRQMRIRLISFGFKYGAPPEADIIMDVRFLANPYFIPELKALDGTEEAVRAHVLGNSKTHEFLMKYLDLLDYLIPLYEKEGKAYLTLAIGCTGGRHRSVVIADAIDTHIRKSGKAVELSHRDINQGEVTGK